MHWPAHGAGRASAKCSWSWCKACISQVLMVMVQGVHQPSAHGHGAGHASAKCSWSWCRVCISQVSLPCCFSLQVVQGAPSNTRLVELLVLLRKGQRPGFVRRLGMKLEAGGRSLVSSISTLGRASRRRLGQLEAQSAELPGCAGPDCGGDDTRFMKTITVGGVDMGGMC